MVRKGKGANLRKSKEENLNIRFGYLRPGGKKEGQPLDSEGNL